MGRRALWSASRMCCVVGVAAAAAAAARLPPPPHPPPPTLPVTSAYRRLASRSPVVAMLRRNHPAYRIPPVERQVVREDPVSPNRTHRNRCARSRTIMDHTAVEVVVV
uniref:Putative secreted protein n=1 Tax=Anopheles darlingi TaxID=43151 RepID=A0A2M4DL67_ANODA